MRSSLFGLGAKSVAGYGEAGSIEVRADGETPVVHLIGEFDFAARAELEDCLQSLFRSTRQGVVLDLSATTFIDSTVINLLVATHRNGFDVTIRGANGEPRKALELCFIPAMFRFVD